jgi:hypothetical protein
MGKIMPWSFFSACGNVPCLSSGAFGAVVGWGVSRLGDVLHWTRKPGFNFGVGSLEDQVRLHVDRDMVVSANKSPLILSNCVTRLSFEFRFNRQ